MAKTGRPVVMSFLERLMSHVEVTETCWIWCGKITNSGYGQIRRPREQDHLSTYCHRVSYELLVGPIPDGMEVDHLCSVRRCVNPDHLEPVTPRENVMRSKGVAAMNAAKVSCIRGHEFTEENTYVTKAGRRACNVCRRIRERAKYEAHPRPQITHCKSGHEMTEENSVWRVRNNRAKPVRVCRTCSRVWAQKYKKLERAKRYSPTGFSGGATAYG